MNDEEKKIIKQTKKEPHKIAKAVGFKDVKSFPHSEWMREIIWGKEDYTLMAHRGSYKSSILSVCIALIMIFFPTINILFFRKTDTDANEMIKMVAKALKSKVLINLSTIIYGEPVLIIKESADTITTNLYENASGAEQLVGLGINTSITGKHADLVITDDICNIKDRSSRAERENTKRQFNELQNVKNRGGRIVSLGTKWHKEDVFTKMQNIHTYTYKDTGLISEEDIQKLKDSLTASEFACNYELKIIADDDVIFTDPQTGGDISLVFNAKWGHIDAAYGGGDYTAYTVARKENGKLYVYGRLWQKAVDDVLDNIIAENERLLVNKMICENNGDKGYLKKEIKRRNARCVDYHEDTNKFVKITTYLKREWKNVVFVEGTDEDYINQICDYNENAEHDDAPDSLACMCRLLYDKNEGRERYQSVLS
jgi:hypothetical protein